MPDGLLASGVVVVEPGSVLERNKSKFDVEPCCPSTRPLVTRTLGLVRAALLDN